MSNMTVSSPGQLSTPHPTEAENPGLALIAAAREGKGDRIQELFVNHPNIPRGAISVAAARAIMNQDPDCLRLLLNDKPPVQALINLAANYVSVACMRILIGETPSVSPSSSKE